MKTVLLALLCAGSFLFTACPARSKRNVDLPDPIANGRRVYLEKCAVCHGKEGQGIGGKFPPLSANSWVNGAPERLVALTVDGLAGRQTIAGHEYNGVMPAWRDVITAPETADVLTYVRQAWGNHAPAVSFEFVSRVSDRYAARRTFWTVAELEAIPADQR
jgi:mono/diheme cytochrome c family protein